MIASAVLSTACATTSQFPDRQLAESRASVRVAEALGATADPHAATYLEIARGQMKDADRAIALRDYWLAERSLRSAQANAELAAALAREANARAEAVDMQRQVQALRARVP